MALVTGQATSGSHKGEYFAVNSNGTKTYFATQAKAKKYAGATSSSTAKTSTNTQTSPQSTRTSPSYVSFDTANGKAYFEQTASGLAAVNDPTILKQLQSGTLGTTSTTVDKALASTKSSGGTAADVFSSTVATPSLAKASAPTLASDVNQVSTFNVPQITPSSGNISLASGMTSGSQSSLDIAKSYFEQQMKMVQDEANRKRSSLEQLISSVTSPAEARANAWEQTGIDTQKYFADQQKGIKEIESLTNEYNSVVAARDQQIAQTNDKMASMNFINNQTAQIERNAAPKLQELSAQINSKAAAMEAQQGNFAQAQSYVNQAVEDAVADYKFKADMYSEMYKINEDLFDNTMSIYSDAFKTQMGIAEAEYNRQFAEKKEVGNLLIENPQAGISINDTLDQALVKIGMNPKAVGGQVIGSAETGYYSYQYDPKTNSYKTVPIQGGTNPNGTSDAFTTGFSSSKIESEIRKEVGAALAQGIDKQTTYNVLRATYNTQQVTDQALKDLIGLQPEVTTPVITRPSMSAEDYGRLTRDTVTGIPSTIGNAFNATTQVLSDFFWGLTGKDKGGGGGSF